jgi:hypothetical protein
MSFAATARVGRHGENGEWRVGAPKDEIGAEVVPKAPRDQHKRHYVPDRRRNLVDHSGQIEPVEGKAQQQRVERDHRARHDDARNVTAYGIWLICRLPLRDEFRRLLHAFPRAPVRVRAFQIVCL